MNRAQPNVAAKRIRLNSCLDAAEEIFIRGFVEGSIRGDSTEEQRNKAREDGKQMFQKLISREKTDG